MLSTPVTREHFYWLCKAICTRVWKRTINHTSSPVRWPNAVHLITIDETDKENKKLPCLAVSMLWSDSETDSAVRASIQTTIEATRNFRKSYDQHLIFVSSRYPSIFSPSSPATLKDTTTAQILAWSEIEGILTGQRELLKSYVAAGMKLEPRWFRDLPPTEIDRKALPPHRPYRKKLPRSFDAVSTAPFSLSTLARFEHLVAAQYSSEMRATLISARNHEPTGYAIAAKWHDKNDPVPYVDLWLLTPREEDTFKLSGLSRDNLVDVDALDIFTLGWVRYLCTENVKRELAREIHSNYEENVKGRFNNHNNARVARLRVRFVFNDVQDGTQLQSHFPSEFPTIVLSWDDLFPGENRDDCFALADVERTDEYLIVKHWKFIYGLEIEHQYKIALNRISSSIAHGIESKRAYDSSIPHTHEVRIDEVLTFSRLEESDKRPRRDYGQRALPRSVQCLKCKSPFMTFAPFAEKLCAKCDSPATS